MSRAVRFGLKAIWLGVMVTLAYLAFEWLVNHGTPYIWNELFQTDVARWRVVPLAIVLSLLLSLIIRICGQRRTVAPKVDLIADTKATERTTLSGIGVIFVIGLVSLLAGASLGPEMSLMALSVSLGTWVAARGARPDRPHLLALAGVGALLTAFFGSLFPMVAPLLLLYQKQKSVRLEEAAPIVLASLAAFGTLVATKGQAIGYGSIPVGTTFDLKDALLVVLFGAIGTLGAIALKASIGRFSRVVQGIDRRWPWPLTAVILGLGLGLLYLVGGESVQFSGSEGVHQLVEEAPTYSALTLVLVMVVKLFATAWSEASGYRGGLVFPSIYVGTAFSLLAGSLVGTLSGPGAMIGTIGGIMAGITSPPLAAIILISLLPVHMIWLGLLGVVGAVVGNRAFKRLQPAAKN